MNVGTQTAPVQKPDYGIDAPGVRRGMFITGVIGSVVAAVVASAQGFGVVGAGTASQIAGVLALLAVLIAAYGLYMGGTMTYGSRIGKLRTREGLLDPVEGGAAGLAVAWSADLSGVSPWAAALHEGEGLC
jgi:hypothetical protein